MPSKHTLAAYETYAKTYQKWNRIPIEWDLKHTRLRSNDVGNLYIWKFDMGCLLVTLIVIGVLIVKQLISRDVRIPLTVLFVNGTTFIVMLSALFVYLNMVCNAKMFVKGYNQLLRLEADIETLEENSHVAGRNRPKPENDFFIKSLKPCTIFCYPSAIIVTFVAMYFKIDPGYHMFLQLWNFMGCPESSWTSTILIGFSRGSILFLAMLETGRVWPLACIVHVSYKMMINNCIGAMHRITTRIQCHCGLTNMKNVVLLKLLLERHRDLQLIMELCRPLDQTALLIQLQMTVICGVVTNFGTLRFYHSLPFVIYHKMPFISLLLAMCSNAVLKYCHAISDSSSELLVLWAKVTGCNGRKGYFPSQVTAIRSLRIHAGVGDVQMLWIERGTKGKFFDFILIQTIDLLLAVPKSVNDFNGISAGN